MLTTVRWRQFPDVIILDELEVEQHNLFIVLNGDSLVHTVKSLRITWFEPCWSKAIYISGDVLVVTAVSVANTDTRSHRKLRKHALHRFLYDLEAKRLLIIGADGQRVESIDQLYLHTLI